MTNEGSQVVDHFWKNSRGLLTLAASVSPFILHCKLYYTRRILQEPKRRFENRAQTLTLITPEEENQQQVNMHSYYSQM